MSEKEINGAAKEHAKKVLGEDQYATNKVAAKSIIADFKAGVKWAKPPEANPTKQLEDDTVRNMNLISLFLEHLKTEADIEIPEDHFLSFFNA